jgi:hypothetical protein
MQCNRFFLLSWLVSGLSCLLTGLAALELSEDQALQMAQKIWYNECRGTVKGLTSWNEGEDFASMGIGHFIWYPEGRQGPFEETFPALLAFLETKGKTLPPLVRQNRRCPWYTKKDFDNDFSELPMRQLREFLYETRTEQALFMAKRLEGALPKLLAGLSRAEKNHIETHFNRLTKDPKGLFMLLDYVNFKGYGTSPEERYAGEGWGLLQVLQAMPFNTDTPHEEFVIAARKVLTARVKNAPAIRNEDRWIQGWCKRVNAYLD